MYDVSFVIPTINNSHFPIDAKQIHTALENNGLHINSCRYPHDIANCGGVDTLLDSVEGIANTSIVNSTNVIYIDMDGRPHRKRPKC